jgi:hypothetical protein
VGVEKNLKNGCLPPDHRAGGVGPGISRPTSGRDAQKAFSRPPQGPFANKKFFLFAKGSLREHPARPMGGRHPARPVGGMFRAIFFLLFSFGIYDLQSI